MNPLLVGILAFIGVATLVGGVVMLVSQPRTSRLEDRLDLLTGAASPSCRCNRPKSMLEARSRGGVPVFSRPNSKPSRRSESLNPSAGSSPNRPPAHIFSPQ